MSFKIKWVCAVLLTLGLCRDITGLDDQLKYHKNWKLLPGLSSCGKADVNERIVGGSSAKLGQYPWIASLLIKYRRQTEFVCGGTLVNENHVLTAAHCITSANFVRLGEHDWDTMIDCEGSRCAPVPADYRILNAVRHSGYRRSTHKHDIALIKLEGRVAYHRFVQPICLPQGRLLTSYRLNGTVTVAGWGISDRYSAHRTYTPVLQHVDLPVVSLEQCRDIFRSPIDEHQYCVGKKNKDSCNGDSGGPMMKSLANGRSRNYFLFGLVSYGLSDCGGGPAVYTNVPRYMKWILDKISC
ncbi:unnamed protein product [Callosobruchus maculatus]|uniref:Peptidase S1 domain-containing protein n=1 Tax=Callosobruchus maculatus TaxID=64391 RepID=A0A653DED1_CALMS|nr:unnamed protein product [Callosobruchus maculatus]